MPARPSRTWALLAIVLIAGAATPARAQDKTVTEEYLALIIQAFQAERDALDGVRPQLAEVDEKIRKFNECKELYEAAGEVSGSRMGGLAAKAAMRARCGATDADGFHKERQKIVAGPEKAALDILRIKSADYGKLKEKVYAWFQSGSGFSAAELALLNRRRSELAGSLGVDLSLLAAGGGDGNDRGGRGMRVGGGRGVWSTDYAWGYIGDMFGVMYLSGATVFEKPYEPGQWTRWQIAQRDAVWADDDPAEPVVEEKREIERAFLGRTPEGSEWWRITSIDFYDEGDGVTRADTVILESLFKPVNEYVKQLVRVRAKLPGQDANEMMVPQHLSMLSLLSVFPMKPTEESVQGATVGSEKVGSFDSRHVRFAAGDGGAIEWWIADSAPGGWVRFRHTDAKEPDLKQPGTYTMQMMSSGSGAKSLLGVMN